MEESDWPQLVFTILAFIIYFFVLSKMNNVRESNIVYDKGLSDYMFVHFIRFVKYTDDSIDDYLRGYYSFMSLKYDDYTAKHILKKAKKHLEKNKDVEKKVRKSHNLTHVDKIRILNFLFEMAASDGRMSIKELAYLESVYKLMNVSDLVFKKIKAKYIKEEEKNAYSEPKTFSSRKTLLSEAAQILNIDKNADFDIVKKAYRTLAKIHHPDKYAQQGDEAIAKAEKQFQIIKEAYDYIKMSRGVK